MGNQAKNPSPNGSNGRDARGRFSQGNKGGPGNPHAQQVARLRAALLDAVKPAELKDIVRALVDRAKQGDLPAAKLLIERLLGPPIATDAEGRLEALKTLLEVYNEARGTAQEVGAKRPRAR